MNSGKIGFSMEWFTADFLLCGTLFRLCGKQRRIQDPVEHLR